MLAPGEGPMLPEKLPDEGDMGVLDSCTINSDPLRLAIAQGAALVGRVRPPYAPSGDRKGIPYRINSRFPEWVR